MDEFRSAPPHPSGHAPAVPAGRSGAGAGVSGGAVPSHDSLRENLADFALAELVRQHRSSFPPPWTIESWAKLLIWLALNSGCAGDTPSLEAFAASLGPERSGRLRCLFFSREFEAAGLRLVADPAEGQVLVQGVLPAAEHASAQEFDLEPVAAALDAVGLTALVVADRQRWQRRDGVVVIPFR
jgi:hypothetical protein